MVYTLRGSVLHMDSDLFAYLGHILKTGSKMYQHRLVAASITTHTTSSTEKDKHVQVLTKYQRLNIKSPYLHQQKLITS